MIFSIIRGLVRIRNSIRGDVYVRGKTHRNDFFKGEKPSKKKWPKGCKAAFNLQLDDFCVKSKSNSRFDYGGDPKGILKSFYSLLDKYPYLKTTLFTIPNPKFISNNQINHHSYPESKYAITNPNFKKWASMIKSASFKERSEIANHGLYHLQTERLHYLAAWEFEFKNFEQCHDALKKSQSLFKKVGLYPVGFKPPSWGIGHNSGFALLKALRGRFDYVCLSTPNSGLNWDVKRVSNVFPSYYGSLLNIPQNINLNWSMKKIKYTIDNIVELGGVITVQAHFNEQDNWMSDGLGQRTNKKIEEIMDYLNSNYPNEIWYAKLEEIAEWWKK